MSILSHSVILFALTWQTETNNHRFGQNKASTAVYSACLNTGSVKNDLSIRENRYWVKIFAVSTNDSKNLCAIENVMEKSSFKIPHQWEESSERRRTELQKTTELNSFIDLVSLLNPIVEGFFPPLCCTHTCTLSAARRCFKNNLPTTRPAFKPRCSYAAVSSPHPIGSVTHSDEPCTCETVVTRWCTLLLLFPLTLGWVGFCFFTTPYQKFVNRVLAKTRSKCP